MKFDFPDEIIKSIIFYSTFIKSGKVTIKKNSKEYIDIYFSDNEITINILSLYNVMSSEIIPYFENLWKSFNPKFHILNKFLSIRGRVIIKYNGKKIVTI